MTSASCLLQDCLLPQARVSVMNPEAFESSKSQLITQITADSRKAKPGTVFVALIGSHTDGHRYAEAAIQAGASAVVIQKGRESTVSTRTVPVFVAEDTYEAFAWMNSALQKHPGETLTLVGVTGTNGKTTVTHLIEKMLLDQGVSTGLIGTLGTKHSAKSQTATQEKDAYTSTGHTTPMADELHEILAEMRDAGDTHVVMEVSSHALDQYRVAGCDFRVAVITNLTQDHLDYHKTMDNYCDAKAKLFSGLQVSRGRRSAVINLDDDYAQRFIQSCPAGVELITYGMTSSEALVRPLSVSYGIGGATFKVTTPKGDADVKLKLAGPFNIYNVLAAISAGLALDIPLEQCIKSMEGVPGIRGRFEVVAAEPSVIVDYAHTPDGLDNVLKAARMVVPEGGRLIAVFGCGGDRDATKRPKMGHIAEELADVVVVTSDNPRTEDPQQIITDILSGIQRFDAERMRVIPDRELAIHQALDLAQPNDLIVVAGKGHEDYQILADRTIHFDDKEVVQAYVAKSRVNILLLSRLGFGVE